MPSARPGLRGALSTRTSCSTADMQRPLRRECVRQKKRPWGSSPLPPQDRSQVEQAPSHPPWAPVDAEHPAVGGKGVAAVVGGCLHCGVIRVAALARAGAAAHCCAGKGGQGWGGGCGAVLLRWCQGVSRPKLIGSTPASSSDRTPFTAAVPVAPSLPGLPRRAPPRPAGPRPAPPCSCRPPHPPSRCSPSEEVPVLAAPMARLSRTRRWGMKDSARSCQLEPLQCGGSRGGASTEVTSRFPVQ